MRISDWSSDVCSSDLRGAGGERRQHDDGALAALHRKAEVHRLALAQQQGVEVPCEEREQNSADENQRRRQRHAAPGDAAEAAEQPVVQVRSEEHTSELQSLMRISYAVFCLKKKKTKQRDHTY